MNNLDQQIERVAARLAALKAQQQAREAREKARNLKLNRRRRTRALVLWGIALEKEVKAEADAAGVVRDLLEKHLTRPADHDIAFHLLDALATAPAGDPS